MKRFYKNNIPDEYDIVLGKVKSMTQYGINVKLMEYDNMEAFLNFKDASNKKRLYQIKKLIKINKEYPLTVMDIDANKNYVNLSKKYQTKEEEMEYRNFYNKYKKCKLIMTNFVRKNKIIDKNIIENYYNKILWKYEKSEIFNIFNKIKKESIEINHDFQDLTKNEYECLYKIITKSIKDTKYIVKFNITINSLSINGKQEIIDYLNKIEKIEEITPYIISIPNYCLEYKNILENDLEGFILTKTEDIKKIKNPNIMIAYNDIEKFEQ